MPTPIRTSNSIYNFNLKLAATAAATANTYLVIDSLAQVFAADGELSVTVPVQVELGAQIQVADDRIDPDPKILHPRLTFRGPFTALSIRIFDRQPGMLGSVVFEDEAAVFVTPSWWEDGTADDTNAVQVALGYPRVRFTRNYRVKAVTAGQVGTVQTKYQIIDMAGFYLDGILGAPTGENGKKVDAVLTLHNWANGRMFNAGIRSDGDLRTPQYALNYGCALRFSSAAGGDPTQFGYIHGLRISNMPVGIVWGAFPTATNPNASLSALPALPDPADPNPPDLITANPPQQRLVQSEFHIYDFSTRGVLLPFFGNAENALLQFHNSIFLAQKFDAATRPSTGTGGWWDYKAGATLVNLTGLLRLTGGSIQRGDSRDGYNLVGQNTTVENCDVERSCTDYLIGDVTYRSCRNGFYGWPVTTPAVAPIPFRVAPGATGRLLLDDVVIRRAPGVANRDQSNLIDAGTAPDYEIVLRDTTVGQWRVDATDQAAYLVHGGRMTFTDFAIDNTGSLVSSYRLQGGMNRLTLADPTGRSMPTTDDLSPKGRWTSIGFGQGGFHKVTADLPVGANEAIRIHAMSTGVEIQTDEYLTVESGHDHVVDFWLKYTGAVSGYFRVYPRWFDAKDMEFIYLGSDGQPTRTPPVVTQTGSVLANNGFTSWLRFRAIAPVPLGAVKAKFSFFLGTGADLMITDLRVV